MKLKMRFLKRIFFFALLALQFSLLLAQSPINLRTIRFAVWAELDAYPGLYEKSDDMLSYTRTRIKNLSEFLMEGMVNGWKFVYTPSDKLRGVEEYLEILPEVPFTEHDKAKLRYSDQFFEENKVTVWCEYDRSDYQIQNYKLWSGIQNPVIKGRGLGKISDGFEGIETAARNALKEAVRARYRAEIKNKPKEISGSVLIRNPPLVGITEGQYAIFLDFFLERDRIIKYTTY
ncbi:hypothetical protein MSI_18120 [Treponema sp. JC4]|jgi:hypothetical protein|uniref:hypothetical protein n=1 Tax=Treponema sp. JC4 TaxID=1124982 RepID=UPI00025B075D|nr:hypothetical protein [Treponema sp. JC4]EID84670.1 hypothetical protein MSI_18120 [Treponema sp. JC4]